MKLDNEFNRVVREMIQQEKPYCIRQVDGRIDRGALRLAVVDRLATEARDWYDYAKERGPGYIVEKKIEQHVQIAKATVLSRRDETTDEARQMRMNIYVESEEDGSKRDPVPLSEATVAQAWREAERRRVFIDANIDEMLKIEWAVKEARAQGASEDDRLGDYVQLII